MTKKSGNPDPENVAAGDMPVVPATQAAQKAVEPEPQLSAAVFLARTSLPRDVTAMIQRLHRLEKRTYASWLELTDTYGAQA